MTDFPQTFADGALQADLKDGVAVVTLSKPEARNAMSKAIKANAAAMSGNTFGFSVAG